jgi:hypothetical protein
MIASFSRICTNRCSRLLAACGYVDRCATRGRGVGFLGFGAIAFLGVVFVLVAETLSLESPGQGRT